MLTEIEKSRKIKTQESPAGMNNWKLNFCIIKFFALIGIGTD